MSILFLLLVTHWNKLTCALKCTMNWDFTDNCWQRKLWAKINYLPIHEGQTHCQHRYKSMTVTWFILCLPVSLFPCDSCSKALLEEVRVKGDFINGDHVIFVKLEILLDQSHCTYFFYCFFLYNSTEIYVIIIQKKKIFFQDCSSSRYIPICWMCKLDL